MADEGTAVEAKACAIAVHWEEEAKGVVAEAKACPIAVH